MNKENKLLGRLGNKISESIGVREGESTVPDYSSSRGALPRRNFKADRDVGDINPDEIIPDPNQPRKEFDEEALQRLGEDIRDRTQLQPIGVRWHEETGKWMIMYGERRWRAVVKVGLSSIKCRFFMSQVSETELRSIQLVENLQHEGLKPMEEAQGYHDLLQLNSWTAKRLSEYLHISTSKISKALKLLELPAELKHKVDSGEIAPATAYHIAKEKNADKRAGLVEQALAGGLDQQTAIDKSSSRRTKQSAPRRSTKEMYLVSQNIRVSVRGRKYLDEAGVLSALLEAVEQQRSKLGTSKRAA